MEEPAPRARERSGFTPVIIGPSLFANISVNLVAINVANVGNNSGPLRTVFFFLARVPDFFLLGRITHFRMKSARVYQQDQLAGLLEARDDGTYRFSYEPGYHGEPVSLTMPAKQPVWDFPKFPAPFEGLLPEGSQLDALLRLRKLDRNDLFGQLMAVGGDVVGSLRIEEVR